VEAVGQAAPEAVVVEQAAPAERVVLAAPAAGLDAIG
jgi:hypothetical protein